MRPLRVITAALVVLLSVPAGAFAHGDASTHYLETGTFYPGFGVRASQATELKLMGLLEAARRAGFPVKLSILGDESDVADKPEMLRHPQRYASFVATELRRSRVPLSAPVVVVSPYGVGVAGPQAKRLDLTSGPDGETLDAVATTAVRTLAEAAGHPLPANVAPAKVPVVESAPASGSDYDLRGLVPFAVFIVIFGSAVLYLQIRTRLARRTLRSV